MRTNFPGARLLAIGVALSVNMPLALSEGPVDSDAASKQGEIVARASISTCDNGRYAVGLGYLRERPSKEGVKQVDVMVRVWSGLLAGNHAVHIHETASCTPCGSAGGHFDPGPHSNPNPDGNHPFHSGDLINLQVNENGRGLLMTVTNRISLSEGPLSLFDEDGSAFIIHHHPDSYCPEGAVSGCAGGSRAACGIIVRD